MDVLALPSGERTSIHCARESAWLCPRESVQIRNRDPSRVCVGSTCRGAEHSGWEREKGVRTVLPSGERTNSYGDASGNECTVPLLKERTFNFKARRNRVILSVLPSGDRTSLHGRCRLGLRLCPRESGSPNFEGRKGRARWFRPRGNDLGSKQLALDAASPDNVPGGSYLNALRAH